MTLTLILTRHAKSSWEDPTLDDIDRPLNRRGRLSAEAVGAWLALRAPAPDTVLVSPARRTQETLAHLRPHLPPAIEVREEPGLYEVEAAQLLSVLRGAGTASPLMVVGHNPGMGDLAAMLAEKAPLHPQFARYPTCATLVLRFPVSRWDEVSPGTGEVLAFVIPRDLGID